MTFIEDLIQSIIDKHSVVCMGLDPRLDKEGEIPQFLIKEFENPQVFILIFPPPVTKPTTLPWYQHPFPLPGRYSSAYVPLRALLRYPVSRVSFSGRWQIQTPRVPLSPQRPASAEKPAL